MEKSVFEYEAYKPYVKDFLGPKGQRSGRRTAMAKHLGCQNAYVSQVLEGHAQLSLEQAYKFNEFAGHDENSAHFFLLLVQKDRAGSQELAAYFQKQMDAILQQRLEIKNRLKDADQLSAQAQSTYYNSWLYAALHMALSIPSLRTKAALAEHFRLPAAEIAEILEFLVLHGLAQQTGDRYEIGKAHIHLGGDSENIVKHHTTWRLQALRNLESAHKRQKNLHYAVTYSLSAKDAQVLKDKMISFIQDNLKLIAPSPKEVLYCNIIDFFEV